jgi:hypothetical protein
MGRTLAWYATMVVFAAGAAWAQPNPFPKAQSLRAASANRTVGFDVYDLSPRQTWTVFAIGPYTAESGDLPVVHQFGDILDRVKTSSRGVIVFNGGYSEDGLYTPAGLLMVKGAVVHPLSFERKGGVYRLSAILCVDKQNKMKFLKTEIFNNGDAKIQEACASAVQAGPYVLDGGRNGINDSPQTRTQRAVRMMIGRRSAGSFAVIAFRDPVDLHEAGEILRGARKISAAGSAAQAFQPDFVDLVNLDGDADAVIAVDGKVMLGDPRRAVPSAFVVRAN